MSTLTKDSGVWAKKGKSEPIRDFTSSMQKEPLVKDTKKADFKRYRSKKEYMNKITFTGPFTIGQFSCAPNQIIESEAMHCAEKVHCFVKSILQNIVNLVNLWF